MEIDSLAGTWILTAIICLISGGMSTFGVLVAGKDRAMKIFACIFFAWPIPFSIWSAINTTIHHNERVEINNSTTMPCNGFLEQDKADCFNEARQEERERRYW